MSSKTQYDLNHYYKNGGIICLSPKKTILPSLEEIAKEKFNINPDVIQQFIQNNELNVYSVPVLIPLMNDPEELTSHIKENYKTYLNIMMTAWPFPIEWWNFQDKKIDFFEQLVDIKYYPVALNAIHAPYTDLLNLSVTLANPTQAFIDYVIAYIISNESTLSDEEISYLKFLTSFGVAIISNTLERSSEQDVSEWVTLLSDSKNTLSALKNKILVTLFATYFKDNNDWPDEISDDFLSQWFDTQTLNSIYLIPSDSKPPEITSLYKKHMKKNR